MTNFCLKPGTALRSPKHTYTIIKVLGQGGFGITYLVEAQFRLGNIDFRHEFTVKELFISKYCYRQENSNNVCCYPNFTNDVKAYKDAFIAESQRLQRLGIKHPNIVNIDEVFEANGTAYYVMEYIKGRALADYVESTSSGRLTFDQTAALMQPICEAVAMLHSHHLVHYDIKPQNIMIEQDSQGSLRPVLIDFGLAKHYNSQGAPTTSPVAGGYSPGYAPVEQYNGIRSSQPTADVYALAATTYFCLIGDRPANADELDLNSVRNGLQRLGIAANAVKAICQALEYRPQSRPADAAALTALLFGQSELELEVISELTKIDTPNALILTVEEMYQKGKVFFNKKLFSNAVEWYLKAAEQGHDLAQYSLGQCYENGEGVTKDIAQALIWYRKAAEQGDTEATEAVKRLEGCALSAEEKYLRGVEYHDKQQYTEAVSWFKKAALEGYPAAQYYLGWCYYGGRGVPQDYAEAVKWYRKAAAQGHTYAQGDLGWCYRNGTGVPKDISKAVELYRKAAEKGYSLAQNNLGWCYENGVGVPQDYAEAVKWYRKAAEQGNAWGQFNLGHCYEYGKGVARSASKALEWYRKAADQGNADAQDALKRLEAERPILTPTQPVGSQLTSHENLPANAAPSKDSKSKSGIWQHLQILISKLKYPIVLGGLAVIVAVWVECIDKWSQDYGYSITLYYVLLIICALISIGVFIICEIKVNKLKITPLSSIWWRPLRIFIICGYCLSAASILLIGKALHYKGDKHQQIVVTKKGSSNTFTYDEWERKSPDDQMEYTKYGIIIDRGICNPFIVKMKYEYDGQEFNWDETQQIVSNSYPWRLPTKEEAAYMDDESVRLYYSYGDPNSKLNEFWTSSEADQYHVFYRSNSSWSPLRKSDFHHNTKHKVRLVRDL